MTTRRTFTAAAVLAAAVPLISGLPVAHAKEDKLQLMFVQTAENIKANDTTLRLVNVGHQTLYFSDRPVRIAGHLTMPAYLDEWKAGEGADNFAADPPQRHAFGPRVGEGGKLPCRCRDQSPGR